jgi:hypothetical protein
MKKLTFIFLVMFCSMNVWANMAAPSNGGQTLSEPIGVKNISIVHEDLTVDFTRLSDESLPQNERFIGVEAVYEIDNPADIQSLDLVFVIVSESRNFQFFLDDREVRTEAIENSKFADRDTWKVPRNTPFNGKELMYNPYNGDLKSAKFSVKLSKGKHRLIAKYKAEPTVYKNIGLTKGWQFAYSLAPARDWKSFGELNLNIKLERSGDSLSGKFTEIPEDFLTATTQMPIPENYNSVSDFYFFLFLGVLFIFPLLIVGLAFWKGYKFEKSWVYGFLFGGLWAGFVALSGYFNQYAADGLIPQSQYASYGYGDGIGVLFLIILVPIVLIIGILLWIGTILLTDKVLKKA